MFSFIHCETNAHIPDDCREEVRTRNLETGVFLPEDDSNRFTRSPKYPARFALARRSIVPKSFPIQHRSNRQLRSDWISFSTLKREPFCSNGSQLCSDLRGFSSSHRSQLFYGRDEIVEARFGFAVKLEYSDFLVQATPLPSFL
jgi:hypothetical protein